MSEPPLEVVALAEAVTSGNVHVHYAKCWPCQMSSHYSPPRPHPWADEDDANAAKSQGRPEPTGLCGCPCARGVEVVPPEPEPEPGGAGPPDALVESTTREPCPQCEAVGACAWDAEGKPLIHAIGADDE